MASAVRPLASSTQMPLGTTSGWQEGTYSTSMLITYLEHIHLFLHSICMLVVTTHDLVDTQAPFVINGLVAI